MMLLYNANLAKNYYYSSYCIIIYTKIKIILIALVQKVATCFFCHKN